MKLVCCAVALALFAGTGVAAFAAPAEPTAPSATAPSAATAAPSAPQSEAGAILQTSCSICHEVSVITDAKKSEADWEATLNRMVAQGASITPAEFATLKTYLVANYSEQPAASK
jgi:cytochrome c5